MSASNLRPCVLLRATKKSGKIDKTMIGLGFAIMEMWALQNTPKSKQCFIIDGIDGRVIFATSGTADGFPKIKKGMDITCDMIGIDLNDIQAMIHEDGRFEEYFN